MRRGVFSLLPFKELVVAKHPDLRSPIRTELADVNDQRRRVRLVFGPRAESGGGSCPRLFSLGFAVSGFRGGDQCANERMGCGGNVIDGAVERTTVCLRWTVEAAQLSHELK